MANKAPLRNDSVNSSILTPDLRAKIERGGSSYELTVVSTVDSGVEGVGSPLIASYGDTDVQTMTVYPWSGGTLKLNLTDEVFASDELTSTAPFLLTATDAYTVKVLIAGIVTATCCCSLIVALTVNGKDAFTATVSGQFDVGGLCRIPFGAEVRVELRAFNASDVNATVTIADRLLTIYSAA